MPMGTAVLVLYSAGCSLKRDRTKKETEDLLFTVFVAAKGRNEQEERRGVPRPAICETLLLW